MDIFYIFGFLLVVGVTSSTAEERKATVMLMGVENNNVKGSINFTQYDNGTVVITGTVTGLVAGKHGFHIHEKGDLSDSCNAAKGHFNPHGKNHGAPNDTERHVGDLGNIEASSNGEAVINITDNVISLTGTNGIIGRALVVHENPDDLGKGGQSDSLTTGHAGKRIACGVVGIQSPVTPWMNSSAPSIGKSTSTAVLSIVMVVSLKNLVM